MEVWVGFVELRQLPIADPAIKLRGRGAFTWITCWAHDEVSYRKRIEEIAKEYGLFVVSAEQVMTDSAAEAQKLITGELIDQYERTSANENFCIFGTLHSYKHDH